eukprot:5000930-Alexandrium_andersonii.AAC.1
MWSATNWPSRSTCKQCMKHKGDWRKPKGKGASKNARDNRTGRRNVTPRGTRGEAGRASNAQLNLLDAFHRAAAAVASRRRGGWKRDSRK